MISVQHKAAFKKSFCSWEEEREPVGAHGEKKSSSVQGKASPPGHLYEHILYNTCPSVPGQPNM